MDRYIAKGEVVVNGKIIITVTPPKAYYKSTDVIESYTIRPDPITMYFREPATQEQITDIVEITAPFQAPSVAKFPTGAVDGAHWLSHAKEHCKITPGLRNYHRQFEIFGKILFYLT